MVTETWADWCHTDGEITVSGTRMKEHSRRSEGVKWCFRCRRRSVFQRVISAPDGLSYYGPSVWIECAHCKAVDGDLFPGWTREWNED
jgi:hypothetical protein